MAGKERGLKSFVERNREVMDVAGIKVLQTNATWTNDEVLKWLIVEWGTSLNRFGFW